MEQQFFWIDYNQKDIWKDWLSRLPDHKRDIYFDPDYVRLYLDNNEGANCYIYAKKDDIYIYPFIRRPVLWISGYFDISTPYGYGGPVYTSEEGGFLSEAYKFFYKEAIKRNIIAELIKFHPLICNHWPLINIFNGNISKARSTVYVDTDIDEDIRWRNIYTHANRKNINKARRNNIEVKFGQDEDTWKAFRLLYEATMVVKKAGEFYLFSPGYFKDIQNNLVNSYILASCAMHGKIISVMLVLLGRIYAHCHLIGTDREFMDTGVNNLLHHELILWCKNNGYQRLHIGGGRSDDNEDLLLRFKKNFSDKMSDFYIGESILNPEVYNRLCQQWAMKNPNHKPSGRLLRYRV